MDYPAVAQLWARTRVADLEDRYRLDENRRDEIKSEIVKLAVAHRLLTRFTAFLAVDEAEIVAKGGDPRKVVQPVHMPDQWEMNVDSAAAPGGSGAMASLAGMPCMSAPMERCKMEAMDDLLEECQAAPSPKVARVMGKKRAGGRCGPKSRPRPRRKAGI